MKALIQVWLIPNPERNSSTKTSPPSILKHPPGGSVQQYYIEGHGKYELEEIEKIFVNARSVGIKVIYADFNNSPSML